MTGLLARHWRVIACVLAVGGAFAFGRWSAPSARVETRDVVRTVEVERVVEKRVEVMVASKAEVRRVVVWRERSTAADGSSVERSIEDNRSATDEHLAQRSDVDTVRDSTRKQDVEHHQVVDSTRPQWRLAVLGGIDLRDRTWAAGVLVERRLWGPVHAGGWAIPWSRAGGVSLGVEW